MIRVSFSPRAHRAAIFEGALSAAGTWLALGVFMAGFAADLGASHFEQGLLAALPLLSAVAQLAGAYLIERKAQPKRRVAIVGLIASRLSLAAILPTSLYFLPNHRADALSWFLILAGLSFLCQSLANVAWLSWMGQVVAPDQRGRFFSARNLAAGFMTVLATASGSWLAGYRFGSTLPKETGYLLIFGVAALLGLIGALLLTRVGLPTQPQLARPPRPLPQVLRRWLHNHDYRRFLVFYLVWMFAVYVASPFFNLYFLQDMQLDIGFVALTATTSTVANLFSLRLWGSLCDRFGNKPILMVAVSGAAIIPAVYLVSNAQNIHWIAFITQAFSGCVWAGLGLASSNLLLRVSPQEDNALYLASFGTLSGLAMAAAPLLGGHIADKLTGWQYTVFGVTIAHFKLLFFVSFVGRTVALLLLLRVAEPEAKPALDVVRALGSWRTLFSLSGLELIHLYLLTPLQKVLRLRRREADPRFH